MRAPRTDRRGNSKTRRARRIWLIRQFGVISKYGFIWVHCFHCNKRMKPFSKSWEVDRHPVCGQFGGRYVHGNIVICCPDCNKNKCKGHAKCAKR